MRQFLLPVLGQQAGLLLNGVHVVGQGQRDDVGGHPFDHAPGLFARTPVRHPHGHLLPLLAGPIFRKRLVKILVKLPSGVV